MVNPLHNKKGDVFIWLVIMIFAFTTISAVVMDFGNVYLKAKKVKFAVSRSVKAGSLAIDKGEQLAEGDFYIKEAQAKNNFREVLADNLGLDEGTLEPLATGSILTKPLIIKEEEVVNALTPTTYTSSTTGRDYQLSKPTFVGVVEVEIRGIFIKKTLTISKLSSSELRSKYD